MVELTRRHIGNVQEALDDVREAIAQLTKKRDERRDSFVNGIELAMQTPLGLKITGIGGIDFFGNTNGAALGFSNTGTVAVNMGLDSGRGVVTLDLNCAPATDYYLDADGDGHGDPTTQINLSWQDNSNNEDGFRIERCQGNNCNNFAQVGQVGANVTTFPSTGLAKNTFYRFRVRAFNAAGNSAFSNVIAVKTRNK